MMRAVQEQQWQQADRTRYFTLKMVRQSMGSVSRRSDVVKQNSKTWRLEGSSGRQGCAGGYKCQIKSGSDGQMKSRFDESFRDPELLLSEVSEKDESKSCGGLNRIILRLNLALTTALDFPASLMKGETVSRVLLWGLLSMYRLPVPCMLK